MAALVFLHPKTDLPVLYKIVRSKLEYCCPVWKPIDEIQKLRGEFWGAERHTGIGLNGYFSYVF